MKALTTKELDFVLKNNEVTKNFFIGTFAACHAPSYKGERVYSFITNTDVHDLTGTHWNSWFVKDNKIVFFDSFGRSPDDPSFPHEYIDIINGFNIIEYSRTRLQGQFTSTCGFYCIHFIYTLSLGLEIKDFISDYFNNYAVNDSVVLNFVDSII